MLQTRGINAYRQASTTITPARQIVMLYEGAMRFVREAKQAIMDGRIEDRFNLVCKAYKVIDALHCCIDFDQGGDIARTLDRYYTFILTRMTQINVGNDPLICDEVVDSLRTMCRSWEQIAIGNTP